MIRIKGGDNLAPLVSLALATSGMTQRQAAERAGVAEGQLSKWRRGAVYPDVGSLDRLLSAFDLDLFAVPAREPGAETMAAELARLQREVRELRRESDELRERLRRAEANVQQRDAG